MKAPRAKRSKTRRSNGYSIYQRSSDGRWSASVTVGYLPSGNARRKTIYANTRREALEKAEALKTMVAEGSLSLTKDVKLADFLESWLETTIKVHRAPKTYSFYRANVSLHIVPALGSKKIRDIRRIEVQQLLDRLSAGGLRSSTVRGVKATISAAYNHAIRFELAASNPATRVSLPTDDTRERTILSRDESARLFLAANADPIVGPLAKFVLLTGLRIGEALGLTWDDLDEGQGVIKVTKQLQRVDGILAHRRLKSKQSRRILPLSPVLLDLLRDLRRDVSGSQAIFLNAEGRLWDPKNVSKYLKALCRKADVPEISFHALRHTHATTALSAGAGLHQVKGVLGHSQVALTANLYGHHVLEGQAIALGAVESAILGARSPEHE